MKVSDLNPDQRECYEFLCDLFAGEHHVHGKIHHCGVTGILLNSTMTHRFSTFDFNMLTTAVLMAHDRMIRFTITPSGPGMLGLALHKRHKRDGRMAERHPTIEQAIASYRKFQPDPDETSKRECVAFFRWWYNQPGTNTDDGYDSWVEAGKPGMDKGMEDDAKNT